MRRETILPWTVYWYLTVIWEWKRIRQPNWQNPRRIHCKCKCWNETNTLLLHLKRWMTKSCWCLIIESMRKTFTTHWMTNTRIFKIWQWMINRCDNKNNSHYNIYGWRWITYDKKWEKFEWFYEDMKEWYRDDLTIDRKDSNWNYSKENCRWATQKQQANNRRTNHIYKWKTLSEWSDITGITQYNIRNRIRYGWDMEEVLWFKKR